MTVHWRVVWERGITGGGRGQIEREGGNLRVGYQTGNGFGLGVKVQGSNLWRGIKLGERALGWARLG